MPRRTAVMTGEAVVPSPPYTKRFVLKVPELHVRLHAARFDLHARRRSPCHVMEEKIHCNMYRLNKDIYFECMRDITT